MQPQRFSATVLAAARGRALVPVPFDPDEVWTAKPRHHISGTVDGVRIRSTIETHDGVAGFLLGPARLRGGAIAVGDVVEVVVEPEGPQRADLAEDVASALAANPQAGAFFDGLAQFYRRGYLRWIDATKRSPQLRAARIAQMIDLLNAGVKDYRNQ